MPGVTRILFPRGITGQAPKAPPRGRLRGCRAAQAPEPGSGAELRLVLVRPAFPSFMAATGHGFPNRGAIIFCRWHRACSVKDRGRSCLKRLWKERKGTSARANRPRLKRASLSVRKYITYAKENMVRGRQSRWLRSDCRRREERASILHRPKGGPQRPRRGGMRNAR